MSDEDRTDVPSDVPEWDDEYLDRVSDRLMFNYDLDQSYSVEGERFEMYGRLHVESQKQLFHPALNYANYEAQEHLFVTRRDRVTTADLDRLVDLGHALAEEWITADEEHHGTEFTFVVVAPTVPDAVADYVSGFRDRTLLKYGYYGQYEVNLVVVAPDEERLVASEQADVGRAFATWDPLDAGSRGLLERLVSVFRS
ncbi:hypothetical protein ACFR9U_05235 [Halorientalis brevis]|uniref:DUF8052 domain-containing protein n=1 Tax=Halorientalis brevis TaxID=1126241 RepID=A0ABD6C8I5_9EURY|nr:hypothetical protein [Halorientalis brevis]